MIKKISLTMVAAAFIVAPFITTQAQTATAMPTLYNQSGVAVNTSGGTLAAGNYFLVSNGSMGSNPVQYYGNGTYYNPTLMMYGGSISNPNGTAGASVGYISSVALSVGSTMMASGHYMAMMPTFYNQAGTPINTGGGRVAPGFYYLSVGGAQVEYYGNGTFYNPSIKQYGGSVTNPNGSANVALGYSA